MEFPLKLLVILASLWRQSLCDVFVFVPVENKIYGQHVESFGKCDTISRPLCNNGEIYGRLDGTCNNLDHPRWGASKTVLPRLLSPEYDDKIGKPRQTGRYSSLPPPRKISNTLKESQTSVSSSVSHLHVLYGQLLAHDIVHTPLAKTAAGKNIDCNCASPDRECVNIELPVGDEQMGYEGKTCIGRARSKEAVPLPGCAFKHREQTTTMSSFIDGTFLYGKSDQEAKDLRDPSSSAGELLLVPNPYGGPHKNLPNQNELKGKKIAPTMDCDAKVHKPKHIPCFVSGDVRVNENTGLTAIQTAFARYHNWLGRELKKVNSHWDSDKVFFEARRIMSAIIQSITYREYLPLLLGPLYMKKFGLTLSDKGYWNGYDSRYDASITNEFTTAAFRYGHSQVTAISYRATNFFRKDLITPIATRNSYFNSEPFLEKNGGGTGSILRGFMTDNAEKTDTNFVDALRNQLFTHTGKLFGMDLFSINIQRGRDHGIAGYNKYRELCGLKRATSFHDLATEIPWPKLRLLQTLYRHVDDIDLYVGGLSESPRGGAVVGSTFGCILSYGMRGLRRGDRFWHELSDSPHPFTAPQLQSIRSVGMASVLCQTGEDMQYVVKEPLRMSDGKHGAIFSCGNIPKLNLKPWSPYSSYPSADTSKSFDTEWTRWFVTTSPNSWSINLQVIHKKLKVTDPDHVCDNFISSATRKVPNDRFIQVRFACVAGTIAATDFPFQLSEKHFWTRWITGQAIKKAAFGCRDIVAIQAMTVDGGKFALQTGDVFETFGPDGFLCQDNHQTTGQCHKYKVRALCAGDQTAPPYQPAPSASTTSIPSTPAQTIPYDVQQNKKLFCQRYNICCDSPSIVYALFIPPYVRNTARSYCYRFKTCCDV